MYVAYGLHGRQYVSVCTGLVVRVVVYVHVCGRTACVVASMCLCERVWLYVLWFMCMYARAGVRGR